MVSASGTWSTRPATLGTNGWGAHINGVWRLRHRDPADLPVRAGDPAGHGPRLQPPRWPASRSARTLAVVHLVGIPLTGTSVNPARSIGPALFEGGEALKQLWLFIVAPLLGGALAAFAYAFVRADVAEGEDIVSA